jgi:hypothetical protein
LQDKLYNLTRKKWGIKLKLGWGIKLKLDTYYFKENSMTIKKHLSLLPLFILLFPMYSIMILTFSSCGSSGGNSSQNTNDLGSLSAPTGVAAVAGNEQITVRWNVVIGATAYNITGQIRQAYQELTEPRSPKSQVLITIPA